MKNWNRTAKIKAIILAVLAIPNLIIGSPVAPYLGVIQYIMPIIFGAFALPLIIKVNSSIFGSKIIKPNWNDNPLYLNRPLAFFQFGGWFMITSGTSLILGSAITYQVFQSFGLAAIMFGIGIHIGIFLTCKWFE